MVYVIWYYTNMKEIKLDENRNPYYPSKKMRKSLLKTLKKVSDYPEILPKSLERSAEKIFKINQENIIFGNGSMELFNNLVNHFGNTSYGLLKPTFWGFRHFLYLKNYNTVSEVKLTKNYNENLNILESLSSNVNVLYLCNPNNPTLTYLNKTDLIRIIKNHPNCYFIIDETLLTYENFYNLSIYSYVQKLPNVIVVISLSKIFGIAGLRCGLMFANKCLCNFIKLKQIPFSTNIITETFFKNNIYEFNNLTKIQSKIYSNYRFLIKNLPLNFYKSIVNRNSCFILIYTSKNINLRQLKIFLETKNIYLRYSFELQDVKEDFIRVSAGMKCQYRILIKYIRSFMKRGL